MLDTKLHADLVWKFVLSVTEVVWVK